MIERIHRDFYVNVFRLGKLNILLRSLCDRIEHNRYLWATNFNSAVLTEKNCKHRIYLSNVYAALRLFLSFYQIEQFYDLIRSRLSYLLIHIPSILYEESLGLDSLSEKRSNLFSPKFSNLGRFTSGSKVLTLTYKECTMLILKSRSIISVTVRQGGIRKFKNILTVFLCKFLPCFYSLTSSLVSKLTSIDCNHKINTCFS